MTVMPLFLKHREEGAIIGRLLAGYGELEYHMAECLSDHVHSEDAAFRLLFSARLSETGRIKAVDSLIRPALKDLGLGAEYADANGAIKYCAKIRNQYAHVHWTESFGCASAWDQVDLAFVQLERRYDTATTKPIATKIIDVNLLRQQEEFFCYARDCFRFVHIETRRLRGDLRANPFPMPSKRSYPPLFLRYADRSRESSE